MFVHRVALLVSCFLVFALEAPGVAAAPLTPYGAGPAHASTAPRTARSLAIEAVNAPSVTTLATTGGTTFYGAPYYDNYAYHNDGYSGSVSQALNKWWAQYQIDWAYAFPGCSYSVSGPTNNTQPNLIVIFTLHGTCGGGGGVFATAYPYKPGKNTGRPCNCVGDPINFGTGNEYRDDTDIDLGEIGLHRYYNSSNAAASTHIGALWRHSFDRSVEYLPLSTGSTATVYRPDGQQVVFTLQSGAWAADTDVADTLSPIYDVNNNLVGWFYTNAATRELEDYDAQGHLLSITDTNKHLTVFTYSDASTPVSIAPAIGLLLTVTDPLGRQLSFTYNSQGNIATVTQPDGGVVSYSYTNGNLVKVTYPDTRYRQYAYNESTLTSNTNLPNALTGEIDENGVRITDIGYDTQGRAILSRLAGSVNVTQVAYGTNGANTVTYPSGVQVTYGFSIPNGSVHASSASGPCGVDCGQGFASLTFDSNGYPSTGTDFNGHVAQSIYNAQGLLTTNVEASGESTQRTTTTVWDITNRVPLTRSVTDTTGAVKAKTSWVYNDRAQVAARCKIDSDVAGGYSCSTGGTPPAGVRRWTYTYCDAVSGTQCPLIGLLLSVDGPRTDVSDITNYSYYLATDESGCGTAGGACHRAGDLYQVTNALGQVTTFLAYDKNGRVIRQSDANGVITDLTYSPRGWLLTRTIRANTNGTPSSSDAVITIGYTPYGSVASITDADGVKVSYTYDAAHRLTDITDAVGDHIHYTLDAAGNKTQEQVYDPSGTVRKALSRTYNTLGQLTQVTDGLNNAVFKANFPDSYDGNGNLVHSSDANSIERKMGYDGLNRLQSTIDNYNGTDPATQNTQSVFSLDANDRLEGVSDPNGLNTTYGYDGLGNATSIQSPDTGSAANQYDAAGNLTQHTDARAVVTQYVYDALNRRTRVIYPAHPALNITYTYDQASPIAGCTSNFNVGRLTTMTDASGSTAWCYTNQGDIREVKQVINGVTYLHGYAYTVARRLTYLQYPSGFELIYGYDAAGRVNSIGYLQQPGPYGSYTNSTLTPLITNVTYFPFGGATSYTWAQGNQSVSRTYDGNGQVSDLTSGALNLHFRRDAMGNIAAEGTMPGANPATESYQYDPLYRLTELDDGTGAKEQAFTYNKTGDRLSATTGTQPAVNYTYQSGTHFLSNVGGLARVPDSNGNTTAMTAPNGLLVGLGYDDRNLLTAVTNAGSTIANYQYNGLGYRVWRTITSPSTGQMAAVYDPAGTGNLYGEYFATDYREYVYLNGIPVASATDAGRAAPNINYLHADHLGTLRGVTDTSGNVAYSWAWQNDAFGDQPKSGAATFYARFPGQYFDVETGLNYNVHRHYESATGRYAQPDPMGLAAGPSLYAYAHSNPVQRTDPMGLDDTVCMYDSSMCGMQGNIPPQDSFVFISGEHAIGGGGNIASGQGEGVLILGNSQSDGFYTAEIAAAGVQVGTDAINYSRFTGYEYTDGAFRPITLNEGNVGESVVKLGGLSGGLGDYAVTDPCTGKKEVGVYAHVSFIIKGHHFAIGVGSSAANPQ